MSVILAYDIGGTHARAALVTASGAGWRGRAQRVLRAGATREALEADLRALTAEVWARAGLPSEQETELAGVGIALPGPTDYLTGTPWLEHKLPGLRGRSLVPLLGRPGVPVACVNDAEAFARGELAQGAARDADRALFLTLGTGLGSCFVADGEVLRDAPDVPTGGELWNQALGTDGRTIEDHVGRAALEAWYVAHGGDAKHSLEQVAALAQSGDTRAQSLFTHLGERLAEGLAPHLRSFAADRVVLGGGIARSADRFMGTLARGLRERGVGDLTIVASALGSMAALVGAAAMVQRRQAAFEQRRVIYLHGLASGPRSRKAEAFAAALAARGRTLALPDLNEPVFADLTLSRQLARLDTLTADAPPGSVLLIGSSLGGYAAALFAARSAKVAALVLLAPAFDFASRFGEWLGSAALERWRRAGTLAIDHHAHGRAEPLRWSFMADAAQHAAFPAVRVPTLVLHGRDDEVVAPALSAAFAEGRPNVQLTLLEAEHTMGAVVDDVVARALAFLEAWWH
ncbi:MAG: ROK family protein [Proteobacteria bacterium]|nr:ROK family protein [Pseudomonadota bacterium]